MTRWTVIGLVLLAAAASTAGDAELMYTLVSPNQESNGYFGYSVAGLPDVNQDGCDDLVVGAITESPGSSPDRCGRAYILSGASGVALSTLISPNEQGNGRFGTAVCAAGDVNNDGVDDVIVGAPEEGSGHAHVFDGMSGESLHTLVSPNPSGGRFGYSVSGLDDVNNDGYDDVIVGAAWEDSRAGRVYVFSGANGSLLSTLISPNHQSNGYFGYWVATPGDIDKDGYRDIAVGAGWEDPGSSPGEAGRAYVFSGATGDLLWTFVSPNEEYMGHFGHQISGAGDVDDDGFLDIIIGTEGEDPGSSPGQAGRAYVFSGANGNLLYTLVSPNEQERGMFGYSVGAAGDLNNDGFDDVIVGAVFENPGSSPARAGRAYVFSGASGDCLYQLASPNEEYYGYFGYRGSLVGDVNGDSRPDVIVGAPFEDPGASPTDAGRAYVFTPEVVNIAVTTPNASTVWMHGETNTFCEWNGSPGSSVDLLLFNTDGFVAVYHPTTANDGICYRNGPIPAEWGTGTDFRIKVVDDLGYYGWSAYFEIKSPPTVSGTIYGPDGGLFGVPVDLMDGEGLNVGSTASDQSGFYIFEEVWPGDYTVSIAPPLGYIPDVESKDITVAGEDVVCDFYLGAVDLVYDQRSVGFWKHQLRVYLTGQGNAQIPMEEFLGFLALIGQHFNNNPVNPVILYQADPGASQMDSLGAAYELLNLTGFVPMVGRAKQQLMALLLNVASDYLPQWAPISEDGATASQAITYCWDLITNGDPSDDERAKDIADLINNGEFVGAGIIPTTVDNISYTPEPPEDVVIPDDFVLIQNYPNPVTEATTFQYGLPVGCNVTLTVHDLQGRTVETLVTGWQDEGTRSVSWDVVNHAAGVYLCRLTAGERVLTKKLTVVK